MRRLFIIRKDLNLSAGKLAAMVGHCAEAYWMNKIKTVPSVGMDHNDVYFTIVLSVDELNEYVKGIFTKTICEAKNLNQLMKAADIAKELGLVEGIDFGFIDDCCKTELEPEFVDENGVGRTRVGIWFKPLNDEVSHKISKRYQLYKG